MRPVADHLAAILALVDVLPVVELPLLDCVGLAAAADVIAPWPLPRFDNSSMDGFAIRAKDVVDATSNSPVVLPIVGVTAAGRPADSPLAPGTAMPIMTGAPIPEGADAVIPVEDTETRPDGVAVRRNVSVGAFVRRAGEDVQAGARVLAAGEEITARALGVLASVGCATLRVHRRPRVVVLPTGDELVEPGTDPGTGKISESNGAMLTACARSVGAEATRGPIVPDEPTILRNALDLAAAAADLVVTSGGVSMGTFDSVKALLSASGEAEFVRVAMQPGMPQGSGRLAPSGIPVITLPGNPVSSFVSFEAFVRPALRRMMGHSRIGRTEVRARLTTPHSSPDGRTQFVRGRLETDGEARFTPVGGPASHLVGPLSRADALMIVPAEVTSLDEGASVAVIDLRDGR